MVQGKGRPGAGEELGIVLVCIQAVRSIMLSVDGCLHSQPLLIISSFGEEGVIKGGEWVVGARSSLINVTNHSKTTLLRVIKVNLACRPPPACLFTESGTSWDGEVLAVGTTLLYSIGMH